MSLRRLLLLMSGGGGSFVVPGPLTAITLTSAPEGGWTFQGNPMALTIGDYTYIGYIDGATGSTKIAVVTAGAVVATKTLHAALEIDDHDIPNFCVRTDGKLHVVYSKHVGPDIYERISTNTIASDPTISGGFATEASLSSTFGATDSTYPSLIRVPSVDGGASQLFCFWREVAGANQEWWYNAHDGSTWGGTTQLHSLTYSKIALNGTGRIDMACSDHPVDTTPAQHIYHLYRESAAWRKSDGTAIVTSMPFSGADLTEVYAASGTDRVWILDIAIKPGGDPVILFARYPSNDTSDIRVMYADSVAGVWTVNEICATGGYIADTVVGGNPLEVYYLGGAEIDKLDPTYVYVSREVSAQWEISRMHTDDSGATWAETHITTGSSEKQIHPVGVHDAVSGGIRAVWLDGTFHSYVLYDLGIKALTFG